MADFRKMPKTVLYYFDAKAIGESCRMLLAYGGVEFEDKRIADAQWSEVKSDMPFGIMPVLEMDGVKYSQSLAICRYLGHKHGLAGANLEEELVIDQNVQFLNDLKNKATEVAYEPDEKVKASKHAEFSKNDYPFMLSKLDEMIKQNNGHLAVGKLTWADFVFAGMYDYLKWIMEMPELDEEYPHFRKLVDTVVSLPKVKEFCASTPKGEYDF